MLLAAVTVIHSYPSPSQSVAICSDVRPLGAPRGFGRDVGGVRSSPPDLNRQSHLRSIYIVSRPSLRR